MPPVVAAAKKPVVIETHYCRWDAPGGRMVRALCGVLMQRRAHANDPTCPDCRKVKAEREAMQL